MSQFEDRVVATAVTRERQGETAKVSQKERETEREREREKTIIVLITAVAISRSESQLKSKQTRANQSKPKQTEKSNEQSKRKPSAPVQQLALPQLLWREPPLSKPLVAALKHRVAAHALLAQARRRDPPVCVCAVSRVCRVRVRV